MVPATAECPCILSHWCHTLHVWCPAVASSGGHTVSHTVPHCHTLLHTVSHSVTKYGVTEPLDDQGTLRHGRPPLAPALLCSSCHTTPCLSKVLQRVPHELRWAHTGFIAWTLRFPLDRDNSPWAISLQVVCRLYLLDIHVNSGLVKRPENILSPFEPYSMPWLEMILSVGKHLSVPLEVALRSCPRDDLDTTLWSYE